MKEQGKNKKRTLYIIFFVFFFVVFCSVTFGPIVRIFDRNDVWLIGMPLSQFWILFTSLLITLGIGALYYIESAIEKRRKS